MLLAWLQCAYPASAAVYLIMQYEVVTEEGGPQTYVATWINTRKFF